MTHDQFVTLMLIVLVLMGWRILFQLQKLHSKTDYQDSSIGVINGDVGRLNIAIGHFRDATKGSLSSLHHQLGSLERSLISKIASLRRQM